MNIQGTTNQLTAHEEMVKREILALYQVVPIEQFKAGEACAKRVKHLKDFLKSTGRRGFVLGISGGVDSTTAGRLAQLACEELRAEGYAAKFYAMRLPAGVQRDEQDAQAALDFIQPDETLTVNVGEASDVINQACLAAMAENGEKLTPGVADYHKGNIKARMRMIAQYHLAGALGLLVIGTDHTGERISSFYTLWGDQACDVLVLNGLSKRQVRKCAEYLQAPKFLWNKAPTADLEELKPGKLDDEGFGYSYEAQNDFLEGKDIDYANEVKIIRRYDTTRYRRRGPAEFKN